MKIVVGMATFGARMKYAEQAIDSLRDQVDEIYLYNNSINNDLTDKGKFYGLTQVDEPCYYFSCDDDIIYPMDYAEKMVMWIERLKGEAIVTHHGRILKGIGKDYYKDHFSFACMRSVNGIRKIDVPGSGVAAWRTDRFNAIPTMDYPEQRMSDLILGLEATKQNVPVYIVPHQKGYFEDLKVPSNLTCFGSEHKAPIRQGEIADEIYKLNHGNKTTKG